MVLALATVADLRSALQDSSFDTTFAQSAIDRASNLVRAVAGQQFDFLAGDVVDLVGGDKVLTLPQRPVVVDVSHPLTVEEGTTAGVWRPSVEGQFWYRQNDRLIRVWTTQYQPWMQVRSMSATSSAYGATQPLGVWPARVRVTYSHGYLQVPGELTAIVLDAAVKLAVNPQGLRAEQVGGVTLTWAAESIRAPRDMVESIRADLKSIGIRRSGAFSIGTS